MEILILICLLIVIVLLLRDKIAIKRAHKRQSGKPGITDELPDIMGVPKSHTVPKNAANSQKDKATIEVNSFDTETKEPGFDIQIPQEELDEVFDELPDFEEEEEEWNRHREPNGEDGFAMGVTFEELSTVGALLQQEVLGAAFEEQAVDIVQKIQGTELFNLLENSMGNASQKIARLLDKSISKETDSDSSIMRNNDLDDFDIGEFV